MSSTTILNADIDTDNSDILWGAEAIARAIGCSQSRTFQMLGAGVLPARKVGRQWVASRGQLLAALTGAPVGVERSA